MTKVISNSLSPNTETDDVDLAFKTLFMPWKWKSGVEIKEFERIFRNYFGFKNAISFNSGRSSLIAILRAMEIGCNDEVILQGFTCNAAVNPILYVGAKPVFADIGDNLNISPEDIKKKITKKTKAVIIQHTFGYPAQVDEIKEICRENSLYIIEDCAHALGARYKGRFCGSFGDASFFSFGRDKIISSVYGGMVVINNDSLLQKVKDFHKDIKYPSSPWIFQQLLHPVIMNIFILPVYSFKWGRALLAFLVNANILSKSVTASENQGKLPDYFPLRMPNALAILAINQFNKLDRYNEHRRDLANYYPKLLNRKYELDIVFKKDNDVEPVFLKYPILANKPDRIINKLRSKGIYLNDGWRDAAVVPPKTNLSKVCYVVGSCPNAEHVSKMIISLPTGIHISRNDARYIMQSIAGIK